MNVGAACPDVACTTGSMCRADGSCAGTFDCTTASTCCAAGSTCNPTSKLCEGVTGPLVPVPAFADQLPFYGLSQVAVDQQGQAYAVGSIVAQASFDGISVSPGGGNDVLVAAFAAQGDHAASWAESFGDGAEQLGVGVGVTGDGTVAVLGNFAGSMTFGPSTIANPGNVIDFVAALNASSGAGKWAVSLDDGGRGLNSIAANPKLSLIAVCGASDKAAPWIPGAVYGGGTSGDAVIGVFNSAGTKLWATQFGTSSNEECDAVTIDDTGAVYAAGRFSGASITIPGQPALTGPSNSSKSFIWLARFDGQTGAASVAAAYAGTTGRATPLSLATDASGHVFLAGSFLGNFALGSFSATAAGQTDAFVGKIDPGTGTSLTPLWLSRQGATSNDVASSVAVSSSGDPIAVGLTGGSMFLWALASADGSQNEYLTYGPNIPVNPTVALSRATADEVVFGGQFYANLSFGTDSALQLATTGVSDQQSFLVWAPPQQSGP